MTKPVEGPITTDFFERRPLHVVKQLKDPHHQLTTADREALEEKIHPHGSVDIGAPKSTVIRAPEAGFVFAWAAFRPEPGQYWPDVPIVNDIAFMFRNYFYDSFGGVIALFAKRNTHIITHSYQKQLFESRIFQETHTYEEKKDSRFPLHAVYSDMIEVKEGAVIGRVGNAGYSTGPHVHWEIHDGVMWQRWENRINPELWLKL